MKSLQQLDRLDQSYQPDQFHRFEQPLLPDVTLQKLSVANGEIWVVRDDLLAGGTKERAVIPYAQVLKNQGFTELVYASPFCGYAQVAMAIACQKLGLKATVFCSEDSAHPNLRKPHAFTERARHMGANVEVVGDLAQATQLAQTYAAQSGQRFLIPLGFDDSRYRAYFAMVLEKQYAVILKTIGGPPKSFWIPVGSGTLARTFHSVLPAELQLQAVDVRVLPEEHSMVQSVVHLPRTKVWRVPEYFEHPAELLPPVPSNLHYDAKLWRFVHAHAENGDLWWNVGP